RFEQRPRLRLAGLAHTGPYPGIGAAFGRMCESAGKLGLFGPDARVLGIFYDDPNEVPAEKLRSFAAVTVPEGFEARDGLEVREIPAGRTAVAIHVGPYSGLAAAWGAFAGKLLADGHQMSPAAPCYEVYLDDMATTPEDRLR